VSFTFRCALIFVDICCTHFIFRSQFQFFREELKEAYKTLYVEFKKLREASKQHIHELNSL
jgi:hypothetical protein